MSQAVGMTGGASFTPTSNLRNETMSKEANDFAVHLKKCEKAILEMKVSAEHILTTTRNVMSAPLPTVFEDTAAAAGSDVKPRQSIGGPGFQTDVVARLSQQSSAQLESQVLVPIKRWTEVHSALNGRLVEVDNLRLEVDSRRHTVISLAAQVDKLRASLSKAGASTKLENQLDETIKTLQHKEGKLALTTHQYQDKEQALYTDLSTLIKDAEWLRHYMAVALRLQGESLIGASVALGESKPVNPSARSVAMSDLSLGSGASANAAAGVRTSVQSGSSAPNPFSN